MSAPDETNGVALSGGLWSRRGKGRRGAATSAASSAHGPARGPRGSPKAGWNLGTGSAKGRGAECGPPDAPKAKGKGAKRGANLGRQFDGRVQQRMERTLGAITSHHQADASRAPRSFPILWWLNGVALSGGLWSRWGKGRRGAATSAASPAHGPARGPRGSPKAGWNLGTGSAKGRGAECGPPDAPKAKGKGAKRGANLGRQFDGRVQQRMERTLGAITSHHQADASRAPRSFPILWWLGCIYSLLLFLDYPLIRNNQTRIKRMLAQPIRHIS